MWVSKKKFSELVSRVSELSERVKELESKAFVYVRAPRYGFSYHSMGAKHSLKSVVMAILDHLNLKLEHIPASSEEAKIAVVDKARLMSGIHAPVSGTSTFNAEAPATKKKPAPKKRRPKK